MSLKDIQKDTDEWAKQFNPPYWPQMDQMTCLTEEMGEVARVMNHLHGAKKKKVEEAKQELGGELCDVIFALTCIANSNDIDLQSEWDKMMNERRYCRDNNRFEKK